MITAEATPIPTTVPSLIELTVQYETRTQRLALSARRYLPGVYGEDVIITEEIALSVHATLALDRVFQEVSALARSKRAAQRLAAARLAGMGVELCKQVLPKTLQKLLWNELAPGKQADRKRPSTSRLHIWSNETLIPWEMVRLFDPNDPSDQGPFLCQAFSLTRFLRNHKAPAALPLSRIAAVGPSNNGLDHAERDLRSLEIESKGQRAVVPIPARFDELIPAMESGSLDGWHFSGHGFTAGGGSWKLQLEDGELTSADLLSRAQKLGKTAPLVFLNSCKSSQSHLALTGIGSMAQTFLEIGAGAFIGSYWEIVSESASAFAFHFYRYFLEGETVGEAARLAREEIRLAFPDDPTWLAYTIYANPHATCNEVGAALGERQSSQEARVPAGPSRWRRAWLRFRPHIRSLRRRLLRNVLAIGILVLSIWFLTQRDSGTIAVLTFANQTGIAEADWLGLALPEAVREHLAYDAGLPVLDRQSAVLGEIELQIDAPAMLDDEQVRRLGRFLGAKQLVFGVLRSGHGLEGDGTIDLTLERCRPRLGYWLLGVTRDQVSRHDEVERWWQLAVNTAGMFWQPLHVDREVEESLSIRQQRNQDPRGLFPTSIAAVRDYLIGLDRYRHAEAAAALEPLERAIEIERHPKALAALAKASFEVGSYERARSLIAEAIEVADRSGLIAPGIERLELTSFAEGIKEPDDFRYNGTTTRLLALVAAHDLHYGLRCAERQRRMHETYNEIDISRHFRRHARHPSLLLLRGNSLMLNDLTGAAIDQLEIAGQRADKLGFRRQAALASLALASANHVLGAEDEARFHASRAHSDLASLNDWYNQAQALELLGWSSEEENPEQARAFFEQSLALHEQHGSSSGASRMGFALEAMLAARRLPEAEVPVDFALASGEAEEDSSIPSRKVDGSSSQEMGCSARAWQPRKAPGGDHDDRFSYRLASADANYFNLQAVRHHLGGRIDRAYSYYGAASEIFWQAAAAQEWAIAQSNLGELDLYSGCLPRAKRRLENAINELVMAQAWPNVAYARCQLGRLLAATGEIMGAAGARYQFFLALGGPKHEEGSNKHLCATPFDQGDRSTSFSLEVFLAIAELELHRGGPDLAICLDRVLASTKPEDIARDPSLAGLRAIAIALRSHGQFRDLGFNDLHGTTEPSVEEALRLTFPSAPSDPCSPTLLELPFNDFRVRYPVLVASARACAIGPGDRDRRLTAARSLFEDLVAQAETAGLVLPAMEARLAFGETLHEQGAADGKLILSSLISELDEQESGYELLKSSAQSILNGQ